jgi:hypothetical protein
LLAILINNFCTLTHWGTTLNNKAYAFLAGTYCDMMKYSISTQKAALLVTAGSS